MSTTRQYDVILYGATGFTGQLVADYFARHMHQRGVRWAMAGRTMARLERVRERLRKYGDAFLDIPLIRADATVSATLEAMAAQTRVVLTTAGPYAELGEALVAACVRTGTDYVDITGEPEFWTRIIEHHDARAKARDVRIVPCCGFDSIPTDLGVLYTVSQLPQGRPATVEGYVAADGYMSGGTWHSAVQAMASLRKFERQRGRGQSRSGGQRASKSGTPLPMTPHFSEHVRSWVAPLPTIDPVVVKRSAELRGDYGEDFRLGYYAQLGTLPKLVGAGVGLGAMYALAQFEETRGLLLRWRERGEGPSERERARSWFRIKFRASAGDDVVVTQVRGGDPGYTETAKMVSEAAVLLATQRYLLPRRAGVLTPASAFGEQLIYRLRSAGIVFETLSSTLDDGPINGGPNTIVEPSPEELEREEVDTGEPQDDARAEEE